MVLTLKAIPSFIEGDILGIPGWWCVISGIFAFFLIAFLIYAYFKGRRMMRIRERTTGIKSIKCSKCGILLREDSSTCPGCGSTFSEDRYICPACGKETGINDRVCPFCKARLRTVKIRKNEALKVPSDPDLMKIRVGPSKSELEECPRCGALIDPGSRCPICKER